MSNPAKGIGIGIDTMGYQDPPAERPDTAFEKAEYALDWLRKIVAAGNRCGVETELDLAYEHGPYPEEWVDLVLRVSFQGDTTCEPEVVWLETMQRIVKEAERIGALK